MKILFFGDSLVWGYKPDGGGTRFAQNERFSGIVAELLGDDYTIIEDGLCGRGTEAIDFFKKSIKKNYPFDMIIIMLGTNDLRYELKFSPEDIAKHVANLAQIVLNYNYEDGNIPEVMLISPTHINDGVSKSKDAGLFGIHEDAVSKSRELAKFYKEQSDKLGVLFFDAATHATPSKEDSLHLDLANNKSLATALAEFIKPQA